MHVHWIFLRNAHAFLEEVRVHSDSVLLRDNHFRFFDSFVRVIGAIWESRSVIVDENLTVNDARNGVQENRVRPAITIAISWRVAPSC